jgi:hypothetical protein
VKRQYRVAWTVAASAGLLGGAGVAVAAVPSDHHSTAVTSHAATHPTVNPDAAELTRLKAQLAGSAGDSRLLLAKIERLEADIARAAKLRQQRAAAAAAAAAAAQRVQRSTAAPQPSWTAGSSAPSKTPASASPSKAPVTHTSTGASGGGSTEPGDDKGSGGGDDD